MHLFIIRHGECRGQIDPACTSPDSELTEKGEEQAQHTAERLRGEGITQIISSPLVRALATASCFAAGLACGPIVVWHELREGWSGPLYQGWGRPILQQRFPNLLLPPEITEEGWRHGNDTYATMFARSEQVVRRLRNECADNARVALVTHGGIGNYLLHALLHIAPATPLWFDMDNCAISHVQLIPLAEQLAALSAGACPYSVVERYNSSQVIPYENTIPSAPPGGRALSTSVAVGLAGQPALYLAHCQLNRHRRLDNAGTDLVNQSVSR